MADIYRSRQPTQFDTAYIAHGTFRPRTMSHTTEAKARGAAQPVTRMHENDTPVSSMQQYNKKVKPPTSIPPQSTKVWLSITIVNSVGCLHHQYRLHTPRHRTSATSPKGRRTTIIG